VQKVRQRKRQRNTLFDDYRREVHLEDSCHNVSINNSVNTVQMHKPPPPPPIIFNRNTTICHQCNYASHWPVDCSVAEVYENALLAHGIVYNTHTHTHTHHNT
jgi:hypothetical protein